MSALELVVLVGLAIVVGAGIARKTNIAPPILFLAAGAAIGFAPLLRSVELPPDVVLFLFLPALLFRESFTTSLREIRNNLRGIVLTSTLLVVATAAAVATAAHLLGMPWGPAWVLGAAVAPTDATAVGSFTHSLPRRNVTVLRAESLVNDGTALVLLGIAVSVVAEHQTVTPWLVTWMFALAYAGGAAIGAILAWAIGKLRRIVNDPVQETVLTILTPFAAYLAAEAIGSSGVIAVVVCGLLLSQERPRESRAATRRSSDAFWNVATFLLNATLFVLVGMELQVAVRGLSGGMIGRGLGLIAAISATLIVIRIAFLFASAYAIRGLDRRPQQKLRRVSHRSRIVSGFAGFRGAVSLAAALSVPKLIESGASFPERESIVFVTSGVIVVTLVVQGLLLPAIVHWADFGTDDAVAEEHHLAETQATQAALDAIPGLAREQMASETAVERVTEEFEAHLRVLEARDDDEAEGSDDTLREHDDYTALRLATIAAKREALVDLRDDGTIDDTVLRELQQHLDVEEVRLAPQDDVG